MTEVLELAATALAAEAGDDCAFTHKDEEHNRTNDFSNNSQVLGGNMGGSEVKMISVTVREKPKKMPLGFQAHHLIPGAAIKGAKKLRKYMTKGTTVKGNVGYVQNGLWNGTWLPGVHKFDGWSAAGAQGRTDLQFAYAYSAMMETGWQLHRWDSSHKDYNAMVRRTLEEIRLKMIEIQEDCKKCKKRSKKPFDPPYRLVEMLDKVARRLERYVTGPKKQWRPPYCTSDYAVLVGQGKKPT
jgi:hypothetical protein